MEYPRNLIFFDVAHNLELPVVPKIDSGLNRGEIGYVVKLRTPALVCGASWPSPT